MDAAAEDDEEREQLVRVLPRDGVHIEPAPVQQQKQEPASHVDAATASPH
jgi:hypothetical protein